MAVPKLPWYDKLEKIVAPTEGAANLALIALIVITAVILIWGKPIVKAAWAVYLVSP